MTQRAFICHSSKDSDIAFRIVRALEDAKIACWIAPRNAIAGFNYAASIIQGIKTSSVMIVVFTKFSNESEAVNNEVEKASAQKTRIIPFKISSEEYSDSLEYYLRNKQSVIAYGRPIDEAINELVNSIEGIASPVGPDPQTFWKNWRWPAVTMAILIALLAIYFTTKTSKQIDISNSDSSNIFATKMSKQTDKPDSSNTQIAQVVKDPETAAKKIETLAEPDDLPAATGGDLDHFFFVRKTSGGNVEYSHGKLGGARSPWQVINSTLFNGSAPSAGMIHNTVYLIARNSSNATMLCQGTFNGNFGDWLPMGVQTSSNPAITAVGSMFYYFIRNEKGEILYNYAEVNGAGIGWRPVNGNMIAASGPSAGSVGNHVFVAVTAEHKIYYNQADAKGNFNDYWDAFAFETNVAPTVVGVGDYIYIFAVAVSGHIWFTRAHLGNSFETWKEVEGGMITHAPVTSGNAGSQSPYIFLICKGTDGRIYFNQGFNGFLPQWALM